jgi:hypothetical protein
LSNFNETLIFLTDFKKYSNIKFPANPELFHAGGWTDRHDEAITGLLKFCERA